MWSPLKITGSAGIVFSDQPRMKMNKKIILIIAGLLLLTVTSGGGYYLYQRHQAHSLYERAQKAYLQKDYKQALELCREITQGQLRLLSPLEQANILINAGNCLYEMDKYADVLAYYLAAEKIIKSGSAQSDIQASLFLKIGNIYFTLNKYDNAIAYLKSAEKIWKLNRSDAIVEIYSNLATIYLETNNYGEARFYYLQAIEETKRRNLSQCVGHRNYALMHYYLADACFELNMLYDAEKYCMKALSVINTNSDLSNLKGKIYHRLALIYFLKRKKMLHFSVFPLMLLVREGMPI